MKRQTSILITILFCLNALLLLPFDSHAQQITLNFNVTPKMPKNQKSGIQGYFSLSSEAGGTENLKVTVSNQRDQAITVLMRPANARTALNGGIEYTTNTESPQSGFTDAEYAIADNIDVPDRVTIPANGQVDVPIRVNVPAGDGGTYLGGVLFEEEGSAKTSQGDTSGSVSIGIQNHFNLAVPILMQVSSTNERVIKGSDAKFEVIPAGYQLSVRIENQSRNIVDNVTGTYRVRTQDGEELFNGKIGPIKMAPKTHIRYPVYWNSDEIRQGVYELVLDIDLSDNADVVPLEFSIQGEQVKAINPNANKPFTKAQTVVGDLAWYEWLLLVIGLIAIILLAFLFGRRKRDNNKEAQPYVEDGELDSRKRGRGKKR